MNIPTIEWSRKRSTNEIKISIFVTILTESRMRSWCARSPPFWRNAPREWGTVWKYHEANSAESFYSTDDRQYEYACDVHGSLIKCKHSAIYRLYRNEEAYFSSRTFQDGRRTCHLTLFFVSRFIRIRRAKNVTSVSSL